MLDWSVRIPLSTTASTRTTALPPGRAVPGVALGTFPLVALHMLQVRGASYASSARFLAYLEPGLVSPAVVISLEPRRSLFRSPRWVVDRARLGSHAWPVLVAPWSLHWAPASLSSLVLPLPLPFCLGVSPLPLPPLPPPIDDAMAGTPLVGGRGAPQAGRAHHSRAALNSSGRGQEGVPLKASHSTPISGRAQQQRQGAAAPQRPRYRSRPRAS